MSLFCALIVAVALTIFDLEPRNNLRRIFKRKSEEKEKFDEFENEPLDEKKSEISPNASHTDEPSTSTITITQKPDKTFESPIKLRESYRRTDEDEFLKRVSIQWKT